MAVISQMTFPNAFFNASAGISIKIQLKFVPNGLINNKSALVTWTNADPVPWRIYAVLGGDAVLGGSYQCQLQCKTRLC